MNDYDLKEIYQLTNVIRYNNKPHLKNESVAEHSFYVALITLKICDTLHTSDTIKERCLIKALLHDLPEIELNDITSDVKTKLNLRDKLLTFENDYYFKHYKQYFALMTKKDDAVSDIVKLADLYSVKQYVINELNLGNKYESIIKIEAETNELIRQQIKKLERHGLFYEYD